MKSPSENSIVVARRIPRFPSVTWDWLTSSDLVAQWFGPFEAEGDVLFVTMMQEEGKPRMEGRILQCRPKEYLQLKLGTDDTAWVIELSLEAIEEESQLTLKQAKTGSDEDAWIDAGWQFYLDCLLAAVNKTAAPSFRDYAPAE